jgi:hypothetical protein
VRCLDTGMYARFLLTPVQDGTFVDGELGVESHGIQRLVAPMFIRRWIAQSLDGLRRAAAREEPSDEGRQQASA